ncbi:MAG: aldo/keto reductase [Firmicutes bacterium]|nr:aldo/keto reductase [Bacillota bacterium]
MEYVAMANGLKVSRITLGCWEMGGGPWEKLSDENNIRVIRDALAQGITSFDTAEGYGQGHSESVLGEALTGQRAQCVVATKVSKAHLRADDLRRSLEQSLKRLRTDFVDIYYVHWPNEEIPFEETFSALSRAHQEGLVRAIGVSNFSVRQLEEARRYAPVSVIQLEYSLLCRAIEEDMIPYCLAHGIGLMTYSSLAKGILSGRFHPEGGIPVVPTDFRRERRLFSPAHLEAERPLIDVLRKIAGRRGVQPAMVALRWLLDQPGVTSAIVGSQNMDHVQENIAALDLTLTQEERDELDKASRQALSAIG